MKFAREYQEGLIRLPIYDASSMVKGQGLLWGVDGSSTSTNCMIDVAVDADDIFAVLNETPATTTSNVQTPIIYQAQCLLVDNPKIWKVYYDMSQANDASVASYSSPTITVAACDDNLDGSWIYLNSGPGAGELRYVSGADSTTFTLNTALTVAATSATDMILIRNVGRPTAGMALDSTFSLMATVLDETTSTNMIVLKNFVEGPPGNQELDITKNPNLETDGLNSRGVRFFTHVIFADNAVHAQGIA